MECSTVISVCNERPHLLYTIQSIMEELDDYCKHEVIVVDNLSTDKTEDFFKENLEKKVRYVKYSDKKSHWNAKNKGIELAKGKNVFFIDGHCIIGRDSLRKQIEFLNNFDGKVGGVHCLHHPMLMKYRKFEQFAKAKFIFRFRRAQIGEKYTVPYEVAHMTTCGMMVQKKVLDELGGWNPEFGTRWGGESYFNLKHATCGYPHFIHPDSHYYHYKHEYGYTFDMKEDGYRNMMIPAYVVGGEEWLTKFTDDLSKHKGAYERPNFYDRLAADVRLKCKDDMEFIRSKQVMSLTDYYKKWGLLV